MTSKLARASFYSSSGALLTVPYSITPGESRNFDLTTSSQNVSSVTTNDPPYLSNQMRSGEWLGRYGLRSQKLTFDQILQQIGFKRVETFNPVIGKTVTAKYAGNLYHEIQHDNGDRYVLTCRPEKLREYHNRLMSMLTFLRKRLAFISSGSRRLFGVIGEVSVCLVCDCKTIDHRIFNQFQVALTSLLKEQITRTKRFNLIWVSNDNEQFREQAIDVTSSNIDQAIDWIYDRKCARQQASVSATCEAVVNALKSDVHGVYLISEGDSSDLAREMLRDTIVKTRLSSTNASPLNVVSLFCHNNDTQAFLRSLAESANGSYFCYKIKTELPDLKAPANLNDPTRIKLQDDKLQFGTNALTPLPEYPVDITLMYKEIIQCQSILDRLEKILGFIRDENQSSVPSFESKSLDAFNVSGDHNFQRSLIVQSSALFNNEENEMSSSDWLKAYGIEAQKLDFFSILQSAAFRHCDGVITLLKPPEDSEETTESTPANPEDKLINAKYCDQFAHVAWPDGTIRHVHVTPELYRDYERRLRAVLEKIKARLAWLKKGSREVFGTVLENNIYILIDTSKSMQHHLGFVKDKLRLLIQDQLFAKERVNLVAFNSSINPWRDRLTKISDPTSYAQMQPWIDGLTAEGTTNTLGALRFALADSATEAIYLLTDGRPDQSERHILSQVQYRQTLPIHTIAFNCQDQSANQFLFDLAKQTGGRFHAFNYGFDKSASVEIPESEDVGYLRQEFLRGEKELTRIATLRDECVGRAWSRENLPGKSTKYSSQTSNPNSYLSLLKSQSTIDILTRPSSSTGVVRRSSKKKNSKVKGKRHRRSRSVTNLLDRGSILNINPDQWLLPETKQFLEANDPPKQPVENSQDRPTTKVTRVEHDSVRTAYDDVKSYLKQSSLVRKGLTIFDVLQPTSINVKDPRHIQVINRYVLAKVWDDILPLAYGSYVGKLRLVNHYAVDLDRYEEKLKELIKEYYQFTSSFIWKHLPDDETEKIAPHLYWESLPKDEQTKITQEIAKEEYRNQSDLEHFAWRKLTAEEQQAQLRKPTLYQGQQQNFLKAALKNAKADSALQGVSRMDVEIGRAIKFLQISTDLRQLQKRPDSEPKAQPEPPVSRKPSSDRSSGQRVICRCDDDGFFRPGTVQKNSDDRTVVCFLIGFEQDILDHELLPINGAIAQPPLFINDRVLVRQSSAKDEYWAPGLVKVLPSPATPPPSMYTAQIYTPSLHQVHVFRRDLLKISPGLFQKSLAYLESISDRTVHSGQMTPVNQLSSNFQDIIRKEIEPLTAQVKSLHQDHRKRYGELKSALKHQMTAIKDLQDTRTRPTMKSESSQAEEISLMAAEDRPETPRPRSRHSDSSKQLTQRVDSPKPSSRQSDSPKPQSQPPDTPKATSHRSDSARSSKSLKTPSTPPPPADFIPPKTRVYAVWTEMDGFAYEGVIVEKEKDAGSYLVERVNLPGQRSSIAREDIFLKSELVLLARASLRTFALIPYPDDLRECLSPAAIVAWNKEPKTDVRFYDCSDHQVTNTTQIIPIDEARFERYTQDRFNKEKAMIDKEVVGFNAEEKLFMLGKILKREPLGHDYRIHWCDGTESVQNEQHVFSESTGLYHHQVNQRVLAIDEADGIFRPAQIVAIAKDRTTLTVRYLDRGATERETTIPMAKAFIITEAYCEKMIEKLQE